MYVSPWPLVGERKNFPYFGTMAIDWEQLLKIGGKAAMTAVAPETALLGAIPEVFRGVTGVGQMVMGRKLAKNAKRPNFEIPASAQNSLARRQNLANGEMPGYDQARQLLAQDNAGSMAAIASSGGGQAEKMAAFMGLNNQANTNALRLAGQAGEYAANAQNNLANAENQYADWQQKQFIYNEDEPYRNAQEKAALLSGEGKSNVFDALKSGGGLIASTLGYNKGGSSTTPRVTVNADGSPGPVDPVDVVDNSRDYITQLGIDDPLKPRDATTTINSDGSQGPVSPVAAPEDASKDYLSQLGIDNPLKPRVDGSPTPLVGKNPVSEGYQPANSPLFGSVGKNLTNLAPIGYDSKTGTVNPVTGPPNYNPDAETPKGPFPDAKKPIFDPNAGADQGYDFDKIQELTAKEKDGLITEAEKVSLAKARRRMKKLSYLLNR